MHPRHLSINDYYYELPEERIASYPLAVRDESKLLVCQSGHISEAVFHDIANLLPANALLVFNNSKVVEARILFTKSTGGVIEVFALEPHEQYADITVAMNTTGSILYKCLVGGAGKWKHGMVLEKTALEDGVEAKLSASIVERRHDCFVIELKWHPTDLPFAQVLHMMGQIPIPPYLHREAEQTDALTYQTVYAIEEGSVAAPTAGLHFTPRVFDALKQAGIETSFVTLHVGAGTFMPVKAANMAGHEMHAEFIDVDVDFLQQLLDKDCVIPVGTTSMRTIESLFWMGVKALMNPGISLSEMEIHQWEVYDRLLDTEVSKKDALKALMEWMQSRGKKRLIVKTQILIAPGYPFKICRGLVTNFHQPKSTLLLLVAALVGNVWRRIYEYAMENDFRFLSYGDSSLLLP